MFVRCIEASINACMLTLEEGLSLKIMQAIHVGPPICGSSLSAIGFTDMVVAGQADLRLCVVSMHVKTRHCWHQFQADRPRISSILAKFCTNMHQFLYSNIDQS